MQNRKCHLLALMSRSKPIWLSFFSRICIVEDDKATLFNIIKVNGEWIGQAPKRTKKKHIKVS